MGLKPRRKWVQPPKKGRRKYADFVQQNFSRTVEAKSHSKIPLLRPLAKKHNQPIRSTEREPNTSLHSKCSRSAWNYTGRQSWFDWNRHINCIYQGDYQARKWHTTLFKRNYSERKINEVIAFCTTNINGDFCLICEPIYADYEHDTSETIRQIDRNNIIYDKICTSH